MPLEPGTSLGSYQVTAKIGEGGMGEVYRARDTKLDRDVALKVLPQAFTDDPDRLARFEREAKVLASLNHPNIGHIYGLEEAEGQKALVLELVEGPTLADRIKQGPIPVDEALPIAKQIAEALEAAHEQGVIHRDLKPANVKVKDDGTVKVLDFGLAKAMVRDGAASGLSASPTITAMATATGVILGTASYMSPEQARGRPLDKRADIWAFGVVLYEMLTGSRAFPGDNVTEALASVVKTEPDWDTLPNLPPVLEAFLTRCLVKDPKHRVHDIADVRLAVTGAYELPATVVPDGPAATESGSGARLGWLAAAMAGLVVGMAGMAYWTGGPAPTGVAMSVRQLTFRQGNVGAARFASDGQVIVYGAAWDDEPYRLYTTRLDSYQSRAIDLPPADLLALSGTGRLALATSRQPVDGFLPRGLLGEVNLSGGAPRVLEENVVAAEWGLEGELAAIVRRVEGQSQLEFPVGTVVHRASVIGPPRLSPDGHHVCFQSGYSSLMFAEVGGTPEALAAPVPRVNTCAWSPDGAEIWFTYSPTGSTHENLEAVSLGGERRVLAAFPSFMEIEDVSPDGSVLIAAGSLRYSVHGSPSVGQRERDLSVFDATRVVQLSASGTELLFLDDSTGTRGGGSQGGFVFIRPMDGSPPVTLGAGRPIAMTSDGEAVAILGDGAARIVTSDVITLVPRGAGSPRTIRLPIQMQYSDRNAIGINAWELHTAEFSDDDQRLLIPFGWEDGAAPRVWVHDFGEERTRPITPDGVTGPVVMSPDGRFVASNETEGLFVYPVDGGDRREVPGGPDVGKLARWSSNRDVVYVLEQDGASARVFQRDIVTGEREFWREVRAPDPAGVTRFDLRISRNGEAYAYSLDRWLTNLFLIENVG